MDVRKVISAIVVAVVLVVGATVAYMYIADVGVFSEKEVKESKDPKESTLGEFGDGESDKGSENEKDKDKGSESANGDDVKEDDADKNSDIVSALDSEEDTEVAVSNVEVTEGKDGNDRVTADTNNGNSIDVFVPGQSTGGEPVVSTDKPKEVEVVLENSGANKNTEKVKDIIEKADAVYMGDVSTGSFMVSGDGINHSFAEGEEDGYRFSYIVARGDSSESKILAADIMMKLGVTSNRSEIVRSIDKALKGDIVDFGNAWVVSGGRGVTVRWN